MWPLLFVLQLCYLQCVFKRYEAAVKKVKESIERIEAGHHKASLMSAVYQRLVGRISQLEAAVEQKKTEYQQVLHLLFSDLLGVK